MNCQMQRLVVRRLASVATTTAAPCAARFVASGRSAESETEAASSKESATTKLPSNSSARATASEPTAAQQQQQQQSAPRVDAKAAEQMKIASELGNEVFEENTEILKQVAARGLRAFVVCAVGLAAFSWAMKRKRKQLAEEKGESGSDADAVGGSGAAEEESDDPTQRYLEEMRGLGFDVDTLEEELEQERKEKAASSSVNGVKGKRAIA